MDSNWINSDGSRADQRSSMFQGHSLLIWSFIMELLMNFFKMGICKMSIDLGCGN